MTAGIVMLAAALPKEVGGLLLKVSGINAQMLQSVGKGDGNTGRHEGALRCKIFMLYGALFVELVQQVSLFHLDQSHIRRKCAGKSQ